MVWKQMIISDQICNRQLKFLSTAKSIIMKPCLILSRVVVLFEVGYCVCVVLDGLQSILCEEKKLHVFIQINGYICEYEIKFTVPE
jgi:hypothetical protein